MICRNHSSYSASRSTPAERPTHCDEERFDSGSGSDKFNWPSRFEEEQTTRDLSDYSLDELREIKEVTNRIAANLQVIQDDGNDLEELLSQTSRIVANLHLIQGDTNDLEDLERQTSTAVANLKTITAAEGELVMNNEETVNDILESMRRDLEQAKLMIEKLPAEDRARGQKVFEEGIAEILAELRLRMADAVGTEKKKAGDCSRA